MAGPTTTGPRPASLARIGHLLRCPLCGTRLSLDADRLHCPTGHVFEISGRVARFVRDNDSSDGELSLRTKRAFGNQWVQLGELATVTSDDLKLHLPEGFTADETFKGLVLDAGCGMGRYTGLVAQAGATPVGMDFSRAVDKAAELWPDITFIQADLTTPPFAPRSFDLVFSFGVLHHLSDPMAGFQKCFELVKPGGMLLVWVYSAHGGVLRQVRQLARRVVKRAPAAKRPAALAAAVVIWCFYVWPNKLVSRGKSLRFYADKKFPQLYVDCHDALAAPAESYLRSEDCKDWVRSVEAMDSGFEMRRDGTGWLIWARRAKPVVP